MLNQPLAGIDTDLGNQCSRLAFSWAQKTFDTRPAGEGRPLLRETGSFCNLLDFGGVRIGMTSDGIGTKVEVAERLGCYETLGYDLTAMVADDLAANGVEPTTISNILDVDRLDPLIIDPLMRGLHDAARQCGIVVSGGEIAELGTRIGGYGSRMHFNWCATAIGVLPADRKPIDGGDIRPGDAVVALKSRGFRSNGFSSARQILEERFGEVWHHESFSPDLTWGRALLLPSVIFSPALVQARRKGIDIHGIAHITGGGIPDNLGRILKRNALGADLNELFPPHDFMMSLQELGDVPDEKAYHQWNMGNGMLVVMPSSDTAAFLAIAESLQLSARTAGTIVARPGVTIHSQARRRVPLMFEKTGK